MQSSRRTRKTLETLSYELDQPRALLSTITTGNAIDLQVGGNVVAKSVRGMRKATCKSIA